MVSLLQRTFRYLVQTMLEWAMSSLFNFATPKQIQRIENINSFIMTYISYGKVYEKTDKKELYLVLLQIYPGFIKNNNEKKNELQNILLR